MGEEQSWNYDQFRIDAVSTVEKFTHIMAAHCGYCPNPQTAVKFTGVSGSKLSAMKLAHHKFRKHIVSAHPDKLSEVKSNA